LPTEELRKIIGEIVVLVEVSIMFCFWHPHKVGFLKVQKHAKAMFVFERLEGN
jgi:hypothetical protein